MDEKTRIFVWGDLHWVINCDTKGKQYATALCPKQRCNCGIVKSRDSYSFGEYKYNCVKCDFSIVLDKLIEEKGNDFVTIFNSLQYKDAEIINIDGELVQVKREEKVDKDYWVDVKLSRNKKGQVQLMVLAGSKKTKEKTQLFLDPKNEKLTFDQNDDHPKCIFAKVVGVFKNSESIIKNND